MAALDTKETEGVRPRRHVPGEPGIWVFILGDMVVFGLFFGVFMYYRGLAPELFNHSRTSLSTIRGSINTLILLTSSLFVALAVRSMRHGVSRHGPLLVGLAFLCGLGFAMDKIAEYVDYINAGADLTTNYFFLLYFMFTGIHLVHVLIGLVGLVVMWRITRRPRVTGRNGSAFEGLASYWHMVDLLWIVLFPLFYLLG